MSAETNRIRVCFPFVGDSIGGSHMSALLLIDGLDRKRYEPIIVIHEEGPFAEHLRGRNISFKLLPLPVYAGQVPKTVTIALTIVRNLPRLVGFLKRENISIVHGNDFRMNLTWNAAAKLTGRPAVWHQRALPYSASSRWRLIGFYQTMLFMFQMPSPGHYLRRAERHRQQSLILSHRCKRYRIANAPRRQLRASSVLLPEQR